ncbi:hypothetical protein [Maribacter forsetii]|uniref:hypothetical protein n=1 Tax=Maribacter forsetii TaxID=444515 RepID=UPI00056B17F0|nr:hypothetical protein [Maribacter forsetii]
MKFLEFIDRLEELESDNFRISTIIYNRRSIYAIVATDGGESEFPIEVTKEENYYKVLSEIQDYKNELKQERSLIDVLKSKDIEEFEDDDFEDIPDLFE